MRSLEPEERDVVLKFGEIVFAQTETLIKQGRLSEKVVIELYPDEAIFLCSALSLANRCNQEAIRENFPGYSSKTKKKQYVYLVHAILTNRYKIGRTTDLRSRMNQLAAGAPYKVNLVTYFETDNSLQEESILHKKLASYRVHGEWFEFSPEQLEDVLKAFNS